MNDILFLSFCPTWKQRCLAFRDQYLWPGSFVHISNLVQMCYPSTAGQYGAFGTLMSIDVEHFVIGLRVGQGLILTRLASRINAFLECLILLCSSPKC